MMQQRQLNALTLIAIGILLIMVPQSLHESLNAYPAALDAFISLLSPIGLILLVLGLYRLTTKGNSP